MCLQSLTHASAGLKSHRHPPVLFNRLHHRSFSSRLSWYVVCRTRVKHNSGPPQRLAAKAPCPEGGRARTDWEGKREKRHKHPQNTSTIRQKHHSTTAPPGFALGNQPTSQRQSLLDFFWAIPSSLRLLYTCVPRAPVLLRLVYFLHTETKTAQSALSLCHAWPDEAQLGVLGAASPELAATSSLLARMLTIPQPIRSGHRPVHDLPTPPNTSRLSQSSPLLDLDVSRKPLPPIPPRHSPAIPPQQMSAPHRGLPPPAAMTIAHQSPSQGGPPPTTQPSVGPAAAVPAVATVPAAHDPSQISHAHVQAHTRSLHETSQLPPPPPWPQHGAGEEVMRAWLVARAEEDKRRAEQERTLQENIRLEQRRTEHEMLRTSLNGGIPPPMVPIVFAGMAGGSLPQATLEWAHQFMFPHGPPPPGHIMQASSQLQMQQQQHQHLITAGASSALAEHQRRSSQVHMLQQPQPHGPPQQSPQQQQPQQMYGLPYGGGGGGPGGGGSAVGQAPPQGSPYVTQNPASPLRTRGYSLTGPPRIIGHGVPPVSASLESTMSHPLSQQQQQQPQQQPQQHQPDAQASPLYIHHWQPPTSQAASGGSAQAASALAESPRKRKATGPPSGTAVPPSTQPRFRSPNFSNSTTASISNPPPGRRRGHTRQRSDVSSYRPQGRGGYSQGSGSGGSGSGSGGGGGGGHSRGMSPSSYPSAPPSTGSVREADEGGATRGQHPSVLPSTSLPPPPLPSQSRSGGSGGCHPVSSLLSDEPSNPYGSGDSDRHRSPRPGGHAADNKGSSSGGNREGID